MHTPYDVVRNHLLNVPAVASIVASRIFKMNIPQSTQTPLILISGVNSNRSHDLNMSGVDRQRISLECRATNVDGASGANTLADAVIKSLDGIGLQSIEVMEFVGDVTLYEDSSKSVRRIIDFYAHMRS